MDVTVRREASLFTGLNWENRVTGIPDLLFFTSLYLTDVSFTH